ncbi:interleukin-21 receptor isoform X1 [Anas platyrhynchos]|uniref:Interleukin 21 receptor n=5 Tax=Anas TaxID=8835 RepID=U3J6L5_ANAPP|nr:interleukin-21 receptor isoform X1 [Anas platyrhynchos]XP_005018670.1 interleukin-21 receptor isoform X1 [Anas platyrhynchos]XP_005018671.1 interleukin-21 receptor isoform X1 [Anas platyrhynchos]XP_021127375.1 interleukin-21 receptor isoform X1 [Anas platyrhynchos]XP_038042657.1 interleukin-21 receptor isoform X1 [Anas platyrhynchos]XP_038042658.1 interleukin-21 receptor isoform X1 [Anas platyrhynchos]XP_038042659.1 interleukin-21 receptor isoform X1 [Anas platyrhynchos]|eukprot:XP_005018669.1 interleukin-21 receptor isoform X1 [Anas platyrhynchos]
MRNKLWLKSISFFLLFQYTMCCENLTCFVDYVQTLSCILRNDLSASSYNLTATWVPEDNPENIVAACSLLQLSRNTSHTQYMCIVDMTELLADIKVQVNVTEMADRRNVISKGFYMVQNIKPQPPFNLTAVFAEGYNISWETIYQNSFYFLNEELEYQLRYKRRTDTWETQKTKSVHEDKRTLVILPQELQGNTEYEFQVRARPREDSGYSGFWSEWSSPLTLKTSPAAVTQTAGMGWMLLFVVVLVITASIMAFLAKHQSLWKKMACIPDPAPFFKPLYLVHNGDFKKWVGTSHTKMTLDFFEWGIVLPEVLEVYSMCPSNSTSQEEMSELKKDLPSKPYMSCLTTPGQDSQSLLSSVNSSSGIQDRSYGHLSIDTVTVADEFTPCKCQCNCNRMYRGHEHTSDEDSAGENGYPKVNIDDEDRKLSSDFHLSDLSTQDKILASGSVSTDHLRTSVPTHQKVERALEAGMGSILEALCLHPNQWDLENPASLPSPDGESVSYSEVCYDFFLHSARPGDSYPTICLDLDTIDSGFADSDCGSPVDCEFEQNSQTNSGSIPLEQEGEDFPRSYVKQWVSHRSDNPVNGTQ